LVQEEIQFQEQELCRGRKEGRKQPSNNGGGDGGRRRRRRRRREPSRKRRRSQGIVVWEDNCRLG